MATEWKDTMVKLLQRLVARRDSEMFREPVPWEALGLSDYLTVIKVPMDLGTVRTKLSEEGYQSQEECASDIRQIWENAMLYNSPGSKVYGTAKTLSEFWETQYAGYANDDVNRPPTTKELQMFSDNCYKISPDALGKILLMLEKLSPASLVKRVDSDEVDVNVDLINATAFKSISQMMKEFQ